MKQAKRISTLFHNGRHSPGMERTSKTSQYLSCRICWHMYRVKPVVDIKCYSIFSVIWIFYVGIKFRGDFYSRVFNLSTVKTHI